MCKVTKDFHVPKQRPHPLLPSWVFYTLMWIEQGTFGLLQIPLWIWRREGHDNPKLQYSCVSWIHAHETRIVFVTVPPFCLLWCTSVHRILVLFWPCNPSLYSDHKILFMHFWVAFASLDVSKGPGQSWQSFWDQKYAPNHPVTFAHIVSDISLTQSYVSSLS